MDIRSASAWLVERDGLDATVATLLELSKEIDEAERTTEGSLAVCADAGPRPWVHRVFGAKRFVESFFSLEWADGVASLIFHDENWSEFRSIDRERPSDPPESTRVKIAHGELKPHPVEECLTKQRAFDAVRHFVRTGERPNWLEYRYVR